MKLQFLQSSFKKGGKKKLHLHEEWSKTFGSYLEAKKEEAKLPE